MSKMDDYDFGGYVTKYNVLCSDGRIITPGAFKNCNDKVVPLISPGGTPFSTDEVIGYVVLENRDDGVYGYGVFNDSQLAKLYQQLVEDESIKGLGIYANHLKENDKHVKRADIQSVMLCNHPANPYAKIDKKYKTTEERLDMVTSKNNLVNTLLKIAEVPEENRTPEQIKSYNQCADMLNYLYGVHIKGNNTLMSINTAIQYMRQAAQVQNDVGDFYTVKVSNDDIADECYHYAKEFNQIADWLEELQQVKDEIAKWSADLNKINKEDKVSYED